MLWCLSVGCWWVVAEVDTGSTVFSPVPAVLHPVTEHEQKVKLQVTQPVSKNTEMNHWRDFTLDFLKSSQWFSAIVTDFHFMLQSLPFPETAKKKKTLGVILSNTHIFLVTVLPLSDVFYFDVLLFTAGDTPWKKCALCKTKIFSFRSFFISLWHFLIDHTNIHYPHCFSHLSCDHWLFYYTFLLCFALFRKMETSKRSTLPMWSKRAQKRLMPLSLNCSKFWDRDPLAR